MSCFLAIEVNKYIVKIHRFQRRKNFSYGQKLNHSRLKDNKKRTRLSLKNGPFGSWTIATKLDALALVQQCCTQHSNGEGALHMLERSFQSCKKLPATKQI